VPTVITKGQEMDASYVVVMTEWQIVGESLEDQQERIESALVGRLNEKQKKDLLDWIISQ